MRKQVKVSGLCSPVASAPNRILRSSLTISMADCNVEGESSVASTAGSVAATPSSRGGEFEAILLLEILFVVDEWVGDGVGPSKSCSTKFVAGSDREMARF